MFLELIGTLFAGIAAAGVMMLVIRVSGGWMPRWLVPVAAGAAMLAVTISSEYSWFARTTATLPTGVVVADTVAPSTLYRPWTYLRPFVTRFVAVDLAGVQQNTETPDLTLANIYLYGRWQPLRAAQIAVDCKGYRRADPSDESGSDLIWRSVGPDDPLVKAICSAG